MIRPHSNSIGICIGSLLLSLVAGAAPATVIMDGSLGPAGSRIAPYAITSHLGHFAGSNLFQSFKTFDVASGETAIFSALPNETVTNVIARVTGGPAHISGTVQNDIPNANLIIVDSAGILFGPGAKLAMNGGSFAASTASYIRLSDGGRFSATLGSGDSTLSSAAPAAFGFLTTPPASISISGNPALSNGLAVPGGKVLSFVAGGIQISQAMLRAPSGKANLISVNATGEVAFDPSDPMSIPDVSSFSQLGTINITNNSLIAVGQGGRLVARGHDMNVDASEISADNVDVAGGGIDIDLTGQLNESRGHISADSQGTANGGVVRIKADSIAVSDLPSDNTEPISVQASASGAGGQIFIQTGILTLTRNGAITAYTHSSGAGGSINVNATREIFIDGTQSSVVTGIAAETLNPATGAGGNITVTSPKIDMLSSAEITSTTTGAGNAGRITVNVAGELNIEGENSVDARGMPTLTGLQARVGKGFEDQGATGRGGQIDVTAGSIDLSAGGAITATNFGGGPGGNVIVHAGNVTAIGSTSPFTGFFARSAPDVPRPGGNPSSGSVSLSLRDLTLRGNAQVSALSNGNGGPAGSVNISARSVGLHAGAAISVMADPSTTGGQITIKARKDIELRSHSFITADSARNGNITLEAPNGVVYIRKSTVSARAESTQPQTDGDVGGQIRIDPPVVVLDHSTLDGRSANDTNVEVQIGADAAFLRSDSQILTKAPLLPPEADIAGNLILLASPQLLNVAQLEPACDARFLENNISSFIVTGRDGEPPAPGGWMPDLDLSIPDLDLPGVSDRNHPN